MSRLPGERAPVSAPSGATLLAPAARDARGRERSRRTGATPGVRRRPGFFNTKRVARKRRPRSLFFELALL